MIKGALFGLALLVPTSVEPYQPPLDGAPARHQLSTQQKNAIVSPLIRSATDCVTHAVTGHPKFRITMPTHEINDLIVASMDACLQPMRAMIDAYDRLFGEGTGEAFFMGPYLEVLPRAVTRQVKGIPKE